MNLPFEFTNEIEDLHTLHLYYYLGTPSVYNDNLYSKKVQTCILDTKTLFSYF